MSQRHSSQESNTRDALSECVPCVVGGSGKVDAIFAKSLIIGARESVQQILSVAVCQHYYKNFKEVYPNTWKITLETYDQAPVHPDIPQAGAQCVQHFEERQKNLVKLVKTLAKNHIFEVALLMAGNNVKEDGALGTSHTTRGAENFFQDRCRASNNDIIGHFKAHIYNIIPLNAIAEGLDGTVEYAPRLSISYKLIALPFAEKLGCKFLLGKLFPWKNLPSKMATHSVIAVNWPGDMLMPGQQWTPGSKSKGISDLTLAERTKLLNSLKDSRLTAYNMLVNSIKPVIRGAAPPPHSAHLFSQREFANMKVNRKGVPCQEDINEEPRECSVEAHNKAPSGSRVKAVKRRKVAINNNESGINGKVARQKAPSRIKAGKRKRVDVSNNKSEDGGKKDHKKASSSRVKAGKKKVKVVLVAPPRPFKKPWVNPRKAHSQWGKQDNSSGA
ncbi:hypothetical protein SERLADRAFT_416158 [Serpula lacrymans var. lacrymans S7.9]|uniref:Uncharacterized protein n=1 Tax=Serpula lacrymans var. lacrymans (strain S7.9) TaxID=578457 RepID=F8NZ09_SERL9|nr:uncharacterized protein SERLADRAFT_416158 [Serpula lacrymans var. lacrymans S7.9]EGO23829.1 hypothetical protein SERLADRAFT_416158 [Serpula lacrymans var. lacrymans S7.9]